MVQKELNSILSLKVGALIFVFTIDFRKSGFHGS